MNKSAFNSSIAEQAAEWVVKLDEGDMSPESHEKLLHWLRKSPIHVNEFIQTCVLFDATEFIDKYKQIGTEVAQNEVVKLPSFRNENSDIRDKTFAKPRQMMGIAASVVFVILSVLLFNSSEPQVEQPKDSYVTKLGEQRSIVLDDGSLINMNTLSSIEIDYSANFRDIYLLDGEAFFTVAHDPNRPLRVWSGNTVTQAIGTEFNVRKSNSSTTVTVLSGKVSVTDKDMGKLVADKSRIFATAGEEVTSTIPGKFLKQQEINLEKRLSWKERKLIFSGEPLIVVISEFNRYNKTQLTVSSNEAAQLSISGIFSTTKPDSFIEFLRTSDELTVSRLEPNLIEIKTTEK